jgi:hypothetical protein
MSNYAPNPKKQTVYDGLAQKKLSDIGAEDITRFSDPTFVQAENQDALLTYNTINEAMFRQSGTPMPEKMKIELTSSSSDGSKVEIITPAEGEVWEIYSGQAVVTGISGSVIHEFYLQDNNSSREMLIYYNSSSSSNILLVQDADWIYPFRIDSNMTLKYEASGTFTTSQLFLQMTRIR